MKLSHLAIILISALLLACGGSPKDKLMGKWKADRDGNTFLEFFPDGTMTQQDTAKVLNGSDTVSGTWMILEDGRLKITLSGMGMSNTFAAKISFPSKDTLVFDMNGDTGNYTRTKP